MLEILDTRVKLMGAWDLPKWSQISGFLDNTSEEGEILGSRRSPHKEVALFHFAGLRSGFRNNSNLPVISISGPGRVESLFINSTMTVKLHLRLRMLQSLKE